MPDTSLPDDPQLMLPKSHIDSYVVTPNTNGAQSKPRAWVNDIDSISGTDKDPPISGDPDAIIKV